MAAGTYRETLAHKGLQPFLWTQFLGAFNDNLFKIVVSLLAVKRATAGTADRQLAIVGAIFILPFLLFSGYAGEVADIYSKRTVLVLTKSLEIVTAGLRLARGNAVIRSLRRDLAARQPGTEALPGSGPGTH